MRRSNDLLLFSGALSGAVMIVALTAALSYRSTDGLWTPIPGGGKEFHPFHFRFLLCAVPIGTLAGISWVAFRSGVSKGNVVSLLLIWLLASIVDFIFLFSLVGFLGLF